MNCTEQEKVLKYLRLKIEKLRNLRVVVVPIVVGELGTVSGKSEADLGLLQHPRWSAL